MEKYGALNNKERMVNVWIRCTFIEKKLLSNLNLLKMRVWKFNTFCRNAKDGFSCLWLASPVWPDDYFICSNFCHVQQWKCAQKHNIFPKVGATLCHILYKPSRNGQILLQFCQGGKISSYLVTLLSTSVLFLFFSFLGS